MSVMRIATFIISVFIVGMVEMMVAGIMNLMSDDLGVSEAIIGQLVTLYALTFAICGPILVKLTNRYPARPVLLWTLVIFIVGNGIIAVAPNFTILVIGRILSSAAASLIIVKVLALTAMLTIPKNRGKMIGVVYTGFSGANVFGVPIGTMIGDWIGWRFTFVFIIVISLIAGLLMLKYLPTTTELNQANRMYNNVSDDNQVTTHIVRPVEIVKFLAITLLILIANSVTFVFINPLILENGHSMGYVSLALLVNGVAGVVGTSMGGVLADKLTSKRWLIIAFTVFIIVMLAINLILSTTILLLVGLFIWNIVQWSTNPAIQSGIIEHVEGDTSQVMSWNMSCLNAGIGLGGIIGGLVVSNMNVEAVTFVSAFIGLLGLIIVLTLKNVHYAKS
ncbi:MULTISPECIES: MFS transporter [Staphylococcus]|uniref:MFS transporter n=1 Tax=Staphylococcus haemolyticus TaxID=1283 RepID=A0A2K0A5S1_STAHA|nr:MULTISPECIES: MFS transporter [Staphylococcus]KGF27901.1 chloramphenicol resistance protein DHA1 [Staphylococcus haemolyticus DNF00585]MCH4389182.1 MFS transporter [Staphylococcus haemolyticus]MCH4403399.1 MFS transporter [Staphylococcus haemolyticus]MCH4443132.1 MFS transporter [Staphylococcus haemolyticus]MCH4518615.1 MFS transporter [Staphylococcus haemolyticus]